MENWKQNPEIMNGNGTTEEVTLDLSQLKMLSGDDDDFVVEILEMITGSAFDTTGDMKRHLANGDFEDLSAVAHKFKSTVNVLGDDDLTGLLDDIEVTAKTTKDQAALGASIKHFTHVITQLVKLINAELTTLRGAN